VLKGSLLQLVDQVSPLEVYSQHRTCTSGNQ